MGIPALVVAVIDNQKPGLSIAEAAGAVVRVKLEHALDPKYLSKEIMRFVACRANWKPISVAARRLVDGKGAARIAAMMGPVTIRPAQQSDCEQLWQWANHPSVRQMAFRQDPIPYDEHTEWYANRLERDDAILFMGEIDNRATGQVRFEFDGDEKGWVIDISVDEASLGRGVARELLIKALVALRETQPDADAIAWVKDRNERSLKLFEACGFIRDGERAGATRFIERGSE